MFYIPGFFQALPSKKFWDHFTVTIGAIIAKTALSGCVRFWMMSLRHNSACGFQTWRGEYTSWLDLHQVAKACFSFGLSTQDHFVFYLNFLFWIFLKFIVKEKIDLS